MYWSNLLAASLTALPSLIDAHGMPGVPKLVGRDGVENLKRRNAFGSRAVKRDAHPEPVAAPEPIAVPEPEPRLEARANTDGPCGPGVGSCAAGYCCSAAGWCGATKAYCASPDCQINYGTGCDSLQVPPGPATSNVPRTKLGSVPYGGSGIIDCAEPGVIALTFDDGPYIYTSQILDVLEKYNTSATFFITGNNLGKGQIGNVATGYPAVIQRMYNAGHQIASHTWGHENLTACTSAQRKNQMYYNEIALNDILGVFPTYMRPPFSECDSACEKDLANLGYHITYFDLDTGDYLEQSPTLILNSEQWFLGNISSQKASDGADWLVISHDIQQYTASTLVEYMIVQLNLQGYKAVTLGECLGDPKANWYRTLGGGAPYGSSTSSASASSTSSVSASSTSQSATTSSKPSSTTSSTGPIATKVSVDATCGGTNGYTCQGSTFGNCCSPGGWCGSTTAYCGAGCQSSFGTCTNGGSTAGTVSPDATCGGTNKYTCQGSTFGNCCSASGWCGSTTAYCGTGCQAAFGTCT